MANEQTPGSPGEFLIYQTQDGNTHVQVRMDRDTVWLSLNQMVDLFQRDKSVISRHIRNVFEERELERGSTVANFATVQTEGERTVERQIECFNLDVIISVGYRVKSVRGTQFRIWATQRLREYIVKGFTLDDERLKKAGGGDHFEELLDRIRDIRSSERVFWRKVLDIYALSEDYDPKAETSKFFFQTVQNKMHWAIHGQTAAEIVHARADASKANMGLTSWAGATPRKGDVVIAKNYLNEEELKALNLIVAAYLDFAEFQALGRKPMTMTDWIAKLDDFIRLTDRDILTHAGKISHEAARLKAEAEYEAYRAARASLPQPVDEHFAIAVDELGQIEGDLKKRKPSRKKGDSE
jgi:hypothetical protein